MLESLFGVMVLPTIYIVLMAVGLVVLVLALVGVVLVVGRLAPEAWVRARCRLGGHPIVRIMDRTGRVKEYVGTKKKKDDIMFKDKGYGIRIDPRIMNLTPSERTVDGVPIYNYSTDKPYPLGGDNVRAMNRVLGYLHKEHPVLYHIPDIILMELMREQDTNILMHDCKRAVGDYLQDADSLPIDAQRAIEESEISVDELSAEMLHSIIKDAQERLGEQPLHDGEDRQFIYQTAFENTPWAALAQNMRELQHIFEMRGRRNAMGQYTVYMVFMAMGLIGIVGAGIALKTWGVI